MWYSVLKEFPRTGYFLFKDTDKEYKDFMGILTLMGSDLLSNEEQSIRHFFSVLAEKSCEAFDTLRFYPTPRDYCHDIKEICTEDILTIYEKYYIEMNGFIRNIFDKLIVNLLKMRSKSNNYLSICEPAGSFRDSINLLTLEEVKLLWKEIFYSSKKRDHNTSAAKIYKRVQKEVNNRTFLISFLWKRIISYFCHEQDVDDIVSTFDGRFLIPAILCKLGEDAQEDNNAILFKKSVFIETIDFLHKNLEEVLNIIQIDELLFMYISDLWYNVIYDKPVVATMAEKNLVGG